MKNKKKKSRGSAHFFNRFLIEKVGAVPTFLKYKKGFLLLEVLISVAILGSALIVVNRAFQSALRGTGLAGQYLLSSYMLEDRAFDIEAGERYEVGYFYGELDLSRDYTIEIKEPEESEEEKIDEDTPLNECNLKLSWGKGRRQRSLDITTYLFRAEEEE